VKGQFLPFPTTSLPENEGWSGLRDQFFFGVLLELVDIARKHFVFC
jgi:hypothetical protein